MDTNNYDNNSNWDKLSIDTLFDRFFHFGRRPGRPLFDTTDIFGDFDDVHKEMDRMFNVFNNLSSTTNAPKELVREYETLDGGGNLRKVGPIVYGYSMTIGPDGKPHIREFGNVDAIRNKNIEQLINSEFNKSQISAERESLSDITTTEKEVKVVLEMPGITEKDLKINAYDGGKVEIKTVNNAPRKYYEVVHLPKEANTETARFTYNNGILEVTFDKNSNIKTKTKDAFVHLRNVFYNISFRIIDFKSKIK